MSSHMFPVLAATRHQSFTTAARFRTKAEAATPKATYASLEAKLRLEKAAREAQHYSETARIDTEVLTLQREANAAIAETLPLEDAAEMPDILKWNVCTNP